MMYRSEPSELRHPQLTSAKHTGTQARDPVGRDLTLIHLAFQNAKVLKMLNVSSFILTF